MGPSGHFYSYWDRLLIIGTGCTLGRAPITKETFPNFREWCWVTRHPRVFRGFTGCQRTPGFWVVTAWYQSKGKRLPWELGVCRVRYTIT